MPFSCITQVVLERLSCRSLTHKYGVREPPGVVLWGRGDYGT